MQIQPTRRRIEQALGIRHPVDWLFYLLAVAVFIATLDVLLSARENDEDWEDYREKHRCVPLEPGMSSIHGGWRCDDGKVHYLWRQQR